MRGMRQVAKSAATLAATTRGQDLDRVGVRFVDYRQAAIDGSTVGQKKPHDRKQSCFASCRGQMMVDGDDAGDAFEAGQVLDSGLVIFEPGDEIDVHE